MSYIQNCLDPSQRIIDLGVRGAFLASLLQAEVYLAEGFPDKAIASDDFIRLQYALS